MRKRKRPEHGVRMNADGPIIVYDTICTRNRMPWLANDECHRLVREIWANATAWLVGRYVLMPDHIHLFAAPGEPLCDYDDWVKYWKSKMSLAHMRMEWRFQDDHWDRRLRSNESYAQKWDYIRQNPVRKGLVTNPDDWPYQGELNELRW